MIVRRYKKNISVSLAFASSLVRYSVQRAGNKFHIPSQPSNVLLLLLFKKLRNINKLYLLLLGFLASFSFSAKGSKTVTSYLNELRALKLLRKQCICEPCCCPAARVLDATNFCFVVSNHFFD